MPWFEPYPTTEELSYWGIAPLTRKVSRWPQPSNPRTKSFFRLPHMSFFQATSGRAFFDWKGYLSLPPTDPPDIAEAGWVQFDSDTVGEVSGETVPHPVSGTVFRQEFKSFDFLPVTGVPGIQIVLTLEQGAESATRTYEWPSTSNPMPWFWSLLQPLPLGPTLVSGSNTPGWPYAQTDIECVSTADCYDFPRLAPDEGFASFNGSTSWIDFPADFPYQNGPFLVEFELRPFANEQIVVGGLKRFAASYFGFNDQNTMTWWNQPFTLSSPLTLGVWQSVRFERDWSIPGSNLYACFIDGDQRVSQVGSTTISPYDELGRRGTSIEGQFDLRNLKQWTGSFASPVLTVDLPLIDNACDLVNPTQKGTTFDMDLPSCP